MLWQVAQAALTATERLLPLLESQVDATLPLLVPALAGAVISTQRSVATAASSVVERIHDTVDPRALLPSALNLLSVGNSKIRPVALQMILGMSQSVRLCRCGLKCTRLVSVRAKAVVQSNDNSEANPTSGLQFAI